MENDGNYYYDNNHHNYHNLDNCNDHKDNNHYNYHNHNYHIITMTTNIITRLKDNHNKP